jgi:ADP-heptose:LPS heptosyltransferase
MKKIILKNNQSPGDLVMLLYAITSLHKTFPYEYKTDVRTSCPDIFFENPFIEKISDDDARIIEVKYPLIHKSNSHPVRFLTAFNAFLEEKLQIKINPCEDTGFLHITDQEKNWYSGVYEILQKDVPYWILNAGHKQDFTAKAWSFQRFQEVVDQFPDVWFVQIGAKHHLHPKLKGKNLIDMVGKTNTRQLIRLVYNSFGVITPVSFPMHLAYAVPTHPRFKRKNRPCVVIAGGREPVTWEHGPNHQFLHTCGMLKCCENGGCWKSRIVKINDGAKQDESLCENPVEIHGQWIGKCMEMIHTQDVCDILKKYIENF